MSKTLLVGAIAAAVGLTGLQAANACHRHNRHCGCGYGYASAAPVAYPAYPAHPMHQMQPPAPAPAPGPTTALPPAPAAGPIATQNDQTYRSFSADPGTAAAPVIAGPPAFGATSDPSNLNASQNYPSGDPVMSAPAAAGGYASDSGNLNASQNHPAGEYGTSAPYYSGATGNDSTSRGGTAGRRG